MLQVILKYVYYGLLLSGFTILMIRRRKLGSIFLTFAPLYFFNLVTQIAVDILTWQGLNPIAPLHINQFIGSLALHTYYFLNLDKPTNKRIVVIGFICFSAYYILHFLFNIQNIFTPDFSDFVVEGILICIYSTQVLLELYQRDTIIIPIRNSYFLIAISNLIFFSGNVFVMGLLKYIPNNTELYYINYILNLVLYSTYLRAFLCNPETKALR